MKKECRNFETMFDDMLDNDISEKNKGDFLEHVAMCEECANRWQLYQSMATTFSQLPKQACPPDVVESIMNNLPPEPVTDNVPKSTLLDRIFNFTPMRFVYASLAVFLIIGYVISIPLSTKPTISEKPYTTSEIKHAEVQIKQALATLNVYTRKTERLIQEDILVKGVLKPMKHSINEALKPISTRSKS